MSHCACDVGHVWEGTPTGTELQIPGTTLSGYQALPPEGVLLVGVVLFITDIFGIARKNPKLWCDRLAAKGFAVVAPDFFRGDAFPADAPLGPDTFMPWLGRHPREKVLDDAASVLAYIKDKWPGLPVSAVGFCWGGLYAALLAGGDSPRVDAAALLHPSLLTADDVKGIARPVFVATNGEDQQVSDAFRAEIHEILKAKPFPTATQHWEEMRHGWTLRGDDKDPAIAAAAEEAFNRTVDWFTVHASKE